MFNKIKSPETLFNETLLLKLDVMQIEMRHQRADLSTIKRQLHTLIIDVGLQKQVDDFMTPPQTDSDKQNDTDDN